MVASRGSNWQVRTIQARLSPINQGGDHGLLYNETKSTWSWRLSDRLAMGKAIIDGELVDEEVCARQER
jgi:hypothetical protein